VGIRIEARTGENALLIFENARNSENASQRIIGLLDEPTGYCGYEHIPAYFIGPDSDSSSYGKGYLLIFPNDENTGRVEGYEIIPQL